MFIASPVRALFAPSFWSLGLLLALLVSLPVQAKTLLRIGYQKSSTLMSLMKADGSLERALLSQDVAISWHEFASGQPLAEALNVGSVDLSADVADTVPVFARAAGADLVYFAREAPSPEAQAILVSRAAPFKTVADLKGQKVAVTKASGSHYLLMAALAKAGLSFADIQPVWLTPADARAAFETGQVAAWAAWEPFLSAACDQAGARILADGRQLADYQRYYLASIRFARQHPQVLQRIYAELVRAGQQVRAHPARTARVLVPLWGNLAPQIIEQANARRSYRVLPVDQASLAGQQRLADAFYRAGLLPVRPDFKDAVLWHPSTTAIPH